MFGQVVCYMQSSGVATKKFKVSSDHLQRTVDAINLLGKLLWRKKLCDYLLPLGEIGKFPNRLSASLSGPLNDLLENVVAILRR
ncbi:hypothetical protein PLANPX_2444 [Lacipirellula parvula]|uniref:Uncharacterized protein n=1 Tax=Lacipirellula parvula TaxID=2650471 RepID=A0A5K7XAA3_9BACT|nr:hypothetical protein PLANPX_2444 [Lacipirellula parvula]